MIRFGERSIQSSVRSTTNQLAWSESDHANWVVEIGIIGPFDDSDLTWKDVK